MTENHFDDIGVDVAGYGSLGGLGTDNLNKVKSKVGQNGLIMKFSCGHCGADQQVQAAWPEVIVISAGKLPSHDWKYEAGHIRAHVGCAKCKQLVTPGLTPAEADKYVRAGVNGGMVNPQKAQQIFQQAKAAT